MAVALVVILLIRPLIDTASGSARTAARRTLQSVMIRCPSSILKVLSEVRGSTGPSLSPIHVDLVETLTCGRGQVFTCIGGCTQRTLRDSSVSTLPGVGAGTLALLSVSRLFFKGLRKDVRSYSRTVRVTHRSKGLPTRLGVLAGVTLGCFTLSSEGGNCRIVRAVVGGNTDSSSIEILTGISTTCNIGVIRLCNSGQFTRTLHRDRGQLSLVDEVSGVKNTPSNCASRRETCACTEVTYATRGGNGPARTTTTCTDFLSASCKHSRINGPCVTSCLLSTNGCSAILRCADPLFTGFREASAVGSSCCDLLAIDTGTLSKLKGCGLNFRLVRHTGIVRSDVCVHRGGARTRRLTAIFTLGRGRLRLRGRGTRSRGELVLL